MQNLDVELIKFKTEEKEATLTIDPSVTRKKQRRNLEDLVSENSYTLVRPS